MVVTFRAVTPLRIKTPDGIRLFNSGDTFTPKSVEPLVKLIKEKRAEPAGPCHVCGTFSWWLSIHNVIVCAVCHPPASPTLVKEWIGDPELYNQMKATRPAVILSWEEARRRKATRSGST
ncbi:MAG: hypothetical protein ABSH25_05755 [Syntrophorhabdales bacterium]|jgi:hypothetical protein